MGLIEKAADLIFGGNRNVVRDTIEVFRENTEAGAARGAQVQAQAMTQYGKEFAAPQMGRFDRIMDGVNRLPRPLMALGTLGMFVSAMVAPLWFAERMQGIALVPEPMWWLLGVIVSFYFGARHQVKSQEFQNSIVRSIALVPEVTQNIALLRSLRADSPSAAQTGGDAGLTRSAVMADQNPALEAWKSARSGA
ncbi:MAG: holin family protein [Sulfitobacter sp.]